MEHNFKNYIRVKIFNNDWHREEIEDYEVTFDKYKRINVMGYKNIYKDIIDNGYLESFLLKKEF